MNFHHNFNTIPSTVYSHLLGVFGNSSKREHDNLNHALKLYFYVYYNMLNIHHEDFSGYVDIHFTTLEKLTSSNFRKVHLKKLIGKPDSLFLRDYYIADTKPYGYTINPIYLIKMGDVVSLDEHINVHQDDRSEHLFPHQIKKSKEVISKLELDHDWLFAEIKREFKNKLIKITDSPISDIYYHRLFNNSTPLYYSDLEGEIFDAYFFYSSKKMKNSKTKQNLKIKFSTLIEKYLVEKDKNEGIVLIFDDKGLPHITLKEDYIRQTKKRNEVKHLLPFLRFLDKKNNRVSVSTKNGRLNHLITSFSKRYLRGITIDNQKLESIDLKSSQITILVNLMLGSDKLVASLRKSILPIKDYLDVFLNVDITHKVELESFLQETILKGDIYTAVQKELSFKTRDKAKQEMLKLLYTEPDFKSKSKTFLIAKYPVFFKQLNQIQNHFKTIFGESKSTLSVFMQLVEAHLFVEVAFQDILENEITKNIDVLTKHDSFLYPSTEDNYQLIKKIVDQSFEGRDFKYQLVKETVSEVTSKYMLTETINPEVNSFFLPIYK